jgi:hypothetical protein
MFGKETKDLERSAGARKLKSSAEAEEFAKEEVTKIVTEELEFEMPGEDTKIPQLKPRYFEVNLTITSRSLWRLCVDLASTCHYWMPFKFLHILVTSKTYLQINMR